MTSRPAPLLSAVLLILACGLAGCGDDQPPVITGEAMGTTYRVRIEGRGIDQRELAKKLAAELAAIEEQASTWRPESWLSQFNHDRSQQPQQPPEHIWHMLVLSDQLVRATGGAFDPTVGPLVRAWGYGPGQTDQPPTAQHLDALLVATGWDKIEINFDQRTVRKVHPEVELDFSALGKGYAVDRMAVLLDEAGCEHYLIEFGGEVFGRVPDSAAGWSVGIQQPGTPPGAHGRSITLVNQAAATSGTYYQDRAADESSHLIDPRTGRPVPPAAQSVTVVMSSCADADAWATALMVLGPEADTAALESENGARVYWSP